MIRSLLVVLIVFCSLGGAMADDKSTVLITGANRGIGLEFVRQFSGLDWRIIATARKPDEAAALQALAADDSDIVIEQLDVTDHERIDELAQQYQDQAIDILLLNAAMGPTPETITAWSPVIAATRLRPTRRYRCRRRPSSRPTRHRRTYAEAVRPTLLWLPPARAR